MMPMPPAPVAEQEFMPQLDIYPPERQRRLTVLVRAILLIPNFIVLNLLGWVAGLITIISWFGALGLGRLPNWSASFLSGYIAYSMRVGAYLLFLVDRYPNPFKWEQRDYPVSIQLEPGQLNRLAVFFRFILMIPAYFLASFFAIGAMTLAPFIWLVVLIIGRTPKPVFGFNAAVLRYYFRIQAYYMMLTSTYPKRPFGDNKDVSNGQYSQPTTSPYQPTSGAYQGTAPYPTETSYQQPYAGQPMPPAGYTAGMAQTPETPRTSATRPLLLSKGAKALLVIAIVLGIGGGVGGGIAASVLVGQSQQGVVTTVKGFLVAAANQNGQAGCALLTPDTQKQLTQQEGTADCPAAFDAYIQQAPQSFWQMLAAQQYNPSDVLVVNNEAALKIADSSGQGITFTLSDVNGTWYIIGIG